MKINTEIDMLQNLAIFRDVPRHHLQLLAFSSEECELPNTKIIPELKKYGNHALLVIKGKLIHQQSNQEEKFDDLKDGHLLFPLSMVANIENRDNYIVIERLNGKIYRHELFKRVAEEFPDFAQQVQKNLFQNLQYSMEELNKLNQLFKKI